MPALYETPLGFCWVFPLETQGSRSERQPWAVLQNPFGIKPSPTFHAERRTISTTTTPTLDFFNRLSDQALANGPNRGLRAVADGDLPQNVLHVFLDRLDADFQRLADLLVAQAQGDVTQHLGLALG